MRYLVRYPTEFGPHQGIYGVLANAKFPNYKGTQAKAFAKEKKGYVLDTFKTIPGSLSHPIIADFSK